MPVQERMTPFDGEYMFADDLAQMFSSIVRQGVVGGVANDLDTYADSTGMQVKVQNGGRAWVGHTTGTTALRRLYRYFKDSGSDADLTLSIASNSSGNPRIDRVIVELNLNAAQKGRIRILEGTPAASPVPPSIAGLRSASTYAISLAQVYVGNGVVTIAADNVTDEREDPAVCGFSNRTNQLRIDNVRSRANMRALIIERMAGQVGAMIYAQKEDGSLGWAVRSDFRMDTATNTPDGGTIIQNGLSGTFNGVQYVGGFMPFMQRRTAVPTVALRDATTHLDGSGTPVVGTSYQVTSVSRDGFTWLASLTNATKIRRVEFSWYIA